MKADESLHDDDLVARIVAGEEEYFSVLYGRYRTSIYRFCYFMVGQASAAEDLFQESFLGLLQTLRKGEAVKNVKGYLLTIARRRSLNYLRDNASIVSLENIAIPAPAKNVDLAAELARALTALPTQYREAFLLFAVQGYSYREIAESLDVSVSVVQNRVFRARQGLQGLLGPDIGVEVGAESENRGPMVVKRTKRN